MTNIFTTAFHVGTMCTRIRPYVEAKIGQLACPFHLNVFIVVSILTVVTDDRIRMLAMLFEPTRWWTAGSPGPCGRLRAIHLAVLNC